MWLVRTASLFVVTAIAEIVGCYLPLLWLKKQAGPWILVPAAASLSGFVWLLSLHPTSAGRVYAAYGGVYVVVALLWLWKVDGVRPSSLDLLGASISLVGMAIILIGARQSVP